MYPMPQPDFGNPSLRSGPDMLGMATIPTNIKPRTGMFGGKGAIVGDAIVGALNGYLAGLGNPAGVTGLQQLHQMRMLQQQQAQQDADYQRERQDKRDDFTFEQDYRTAHPTPYRWESNDGSLMEMGPDGQARVVYKDPTPKLNWIQVRDPATGGLSIVPVGPNGPVGGQPQLGAPAAPGVTFAPLDEGGQTGTPSGGFPY